MLKFIKRMFCKHTFRLTKFQALGPYNSEVCTKCGEERTTLSRWG